MQHELVHHHLLTILKTQLSDLHDNVGMPTQTVMKERFDHVGELENFQSREDPEYSRWADTRLDRWIIDWALRNGKEKTARKIAAKKGIEVKILHILFLCPY